MPRVVANVARVSRMAAAVLLAVSASSDARADEPKALAPGGQIVIYAQLEAKDQPHGEEWGLYLVDLGTEAWTKLDSVPMRNGIPELARFRVSPDRRRIAFNDFRRNTTFASENSVWVRDLREGAEARKISDIGGRPMWAADGKHLLVVEAKGHDPGRPDGPIRFATWMIDDDGSHAVRLPVPEADMVADWSPDGRWLVTYAPIPGDGGEAGYANFVMHPDGTGRRHLPGPGVGVFPRFSPDSQRIAYCTRGKDTATIQGKSLWIVGVDGKDRRLIFHEPESVFLDGSIAWSPEGRRLAMVRSTWTKVREGVVTPRDPRLCVIHVDDRKMETVRHRRATLLGHPEWR